MADDRNEDVLVIGAGLGSVMQQAAALALLSVGGGRSLFAHDSDLLRIDIGNDLGWDVEAIEAANRREAARQRRRPLQASSRFDIVHVDTPKVKGKRALRRARGRARA